MLSVLKVQEIGQNPFACLSALFRVELRGVEVVLLDGRAERMDVLGLCCRTFVDRYVETMDEIDEFFLVETFEQVPPCLGQCIPSHVRYLVLVLLSLISWSSPVRRR